MDSYQKRNLYSEAKKLEFKVVYSMKHPSIKVVMQSLSLKKIETNKFKTTTIDIEYFGICADIFYEKWIFNINDEWRDLEKI